MLVLLTAIFTFTPGFGIVVPVIGYFVKGMGATALDPGMVTPWLPGDLSSMLAAAGALPLQALLPVAATILWTAAFAGATLWKFERIEF